MQILQNISNNLNVDPIQLITRILAWFTAIPLHEQAHAYVSYKLGDPTAKNAGRLTLNPLKSIDPMGLICMLLIGFGWAKPVPIDASYYKKPKEGMALTALAGPVTNLILAYISMLVYKIFTYSSQVVLLNAGTSVIPSWVSIVSQIILYFSVINVALAVFNLLPIPPLDGSRVLGLVLPTKLYFGIQKYERFIMIALFICIFLGAFDGILRTLNTAAIQGLDWSTGYVNKIFESVFPTMFSSNVANSTI